jgi:hypothetical protein
VALVLGASAQAADRVVDWHSTIRIGADGVLTVTERIALEVDGGELSRGLRREMALEHRDRFGGRASVPLEILSLTRDGAPEAWQLEGGLHAERLSTGALERGRHTYELQYRTALQVGHFPDHDELYWPLRADDLPIGIEHISAEVLLPRPVAAGELRAEAYTGARGARGRDYQSMMRDGAVGFSSTRPFAPHQGMSIVVGFPKGVVEPPPLWRRAGWYLSRNPHTIAGFAALVVLGGFLYRRQKKQPRRAPDPSA